MQSFFMIDNYELIRAMRQRADRQSKPPAIIRDGGIPRKIVDPTLRGPWGTEDFFPSQRDIKAANDLEAMGVSFSGKRL